jgi:DNA-binding MarR family transcriptional regulator
MEELSKSMQVIRTLKQVMGVFRQNMESQFKDMNLTGPQGMLLGTLAHYGKMKVSDISERLGLSNSTVSGILDRLEKQSLVERIRSEEDRRVVYVNITPEFKKISEQRFKDIEKFFEARMSKANPEDLDRMLEGLKTFIKILE